MRWKKRTWSWSQRTRFWGSTLRTSCLPPVCSRPPTPRANGNEAWNTIVPQPEWTLFSLKGQYTQGPVYFYPLVSSNVHHQFLTCTSLCGITLSSEFVYIFYMYSFFSLYSLPFHSVHYDRGCLWMPLKQTDLLSLSLAVTELMEAFCSLWSDIHSTNAHQALYAALLVATQLSRPSACFSWVQLFQMF